MIRVNASGQLTARFTDPYGYGDVFYPQGICLDQSGNLNVVDPDNDYVLMWSVVYYNSEPQLFNVYNGDPVACAVDHSYNLYVVDIKYNSILKFNSASTLLPFAPGGGIVNLLT